MNELVLKAATSARKTHRKTRTGCRTCKSRKIKCDETKPSCYNCIKHSVQCDFVLAPPTGSPANAEGLHSPAASPSANGANGTHTLDQDAKIAQNDLQSPSLNLMDLELLHNYVTSTANTLNADPALKALWKINIPQVGFQHEFVMRGILALSALHLARYKPEKKDLYISQAMLQHQTGLQIAASVLMHPNNEEIPVSLYIFSTLTLYFTLACPRKPVDLLLVGDNGVADWLLFIRANSSIFKSSQATLLRSSLGPMFLAVERRTQLYEQFFTEETQNLSVEQDPLVEIKDLIKASNIDPRLVAVYNSTIDLLRRPFVFFHSQRSPGFELCDIFIWVLELPDEYLQLLRQRAQEAIVIFSFFCVGLKRMDSHWWAEGWGIGLISKIYSLLDEEHRLWIRWPIEEIGWIPNYNMRVSA